MPNRAGGMTLYLLLTPFILWILLLLALPHIDMLVLSLREKVGIRTYEYGFANYVEFLSESIYRDTLIRTAVMSIFVTFLTLILGFPIAYYIAKVASRRIRAALFLACLAPLWVSDIVRAFGWQLLLRETGVLSSFLVWGGVVSEPVEFLYNDATIIVGLIYTVILFMVVPLVSVLDGMDDSLVEAGYNLGGSRITVLRRIIIPYATPGIVAGSIIVFMLTAGSYLTPIILGGKNSTWFTEQIYNQFITRFNWEAGAAFGFVLLVFTSITVWAGLRLTGQTLTGTVARH